jgi:hypothetical protein
MKHFPGNCLRNSLVVLLSFLIAVAATSCGDEGDDNDNEKENIGWVTITVPTTSDTYNVTNETTIYIAGDTFISPAAEWKEESVCHCSGWGCLINPSCTTFQRYYDTAVTVSVNNNTTGDFYQFSSGEHWSATVRLAPKNNVIGVTAADTLGNWGVDQITVYMEDTILPEILSTTPENDAVVSIASTITITFSEAMDTDTITESSFTVSDGSSDVSGTISFSSEDAVAEFTPTANLSYDTTYTVTLNSTIQDLYGNALTTTTWSFKTVP